MKIVLQAAGVPVSPWVTVTARRVGPRRGHRAGGCRGPGSAAVRQARARGVERRRVEGRRRRASSTRRWQLAFAEDDKVLIETAIVGARSRSRSSKVAAAQAPRASLPGEIVLTTREFYDFEGKYLGGDGAEVVCPADLTDAEIAAVQELGIRAFDAVDGRGLARVDFFLTRRRAVRQRAQHDAGLHADLDVPEVLDRVGDVVPRADLGTHRHGAGARRGVTRLSRSSRRRCTPSRRGEGCRRSATACRAPERSRRRRCRGRSRRQARARTS